MSNLVNVTLICVLIPKFLTFSCLLWLNNIIIDKYLTASGINHRFNHIYTHAGSLYWLMSSRLLFSYSIDISLSNDLSSQLEIKGRTSNLELSNKPNRNAILPLLYMAEKVHSMFLLVCLVSWSGRFSTRTAPGLIGSRGAWLRTATLTSPCQATNPSTSELFQRTGEKIITLYIYFLKMLHAYATCLFVAKIAVVFFLLIFEVWNKILCAISLRKKEFCQTDMAHCNTISTVF